MTNKLIVLNHIKSEFTFHYFLKIIVELLSNNFKEIIVFKSDD